MSKTLTNLVTHIVFSTKGRQQSIDSEIRPRLHSYMGGIARSLNIEAIAINGTADHVHLLLRIPPSLALSDVVRIIKANSSRWVHQTNPTRRLFTWQTGFGAFTVSHSVAPRVVDYIGAQERHHLMRTFQDEYLDMLRNNNVSYDAQFLWT